MLNFKTITPDDTEMLYEYFKGCNYKLCEYSVGVIMMWRHRFNFEYTESNGCLVIKVVTNGDISFYCPIEKDESSDASAALDELEGYCIKLGITLKFWALPDELLPKLTKRYFSLFMDSSRLWSDYIYSAKDMMEFKGKKYSGQRNHINKFKKLYPQYIYRRLNKNDTEKLKSFFERFETEFSDSQKIAEEELEKAKEMIFDYPKQIYKAACIEIDGRIAAVSLGEICGETLIIHIEKALYEYAGIYPAMVNLFANDFAKNVKYINREDDACNKGLRTSKLQYQPMLLGDKHGAEIFTVATEITEIPTIETERLVIDALTHEDAKEYCKLCADDELNKYWGYDYRDDLKGELYTDYFFDVAQNDFKNHTTVNFAIRLNGKFIGEAVLYTFDFEGGCELGLRIFADYFGNGYGREAFSAVADLALYKFGVRKLYAKCFKQNLASFKMLSSCMRIAATDDNFYYFEKLS